MLKKRWILILGGGALCLLGIAALVASTLGTASASTRPLHNGWLGSGTSTATLNGQLANTTGGHGKEVRVVFVQQSVLVNTTSNGFTQFVVSGPVIRRSKTVGFGVVRCAVAAPAPAPNQGLAECDGTFNLGSPFPAGSQITIQGLSSPATHWFNAITGGTGHFSEARGVVESQNIGTTNKISLDFRVTH
jgi:hypothetical protein